VEHRAPYYLRHAGLHREQKIAQCAGWRQKVADMRKKSLGRKSAHIAQIESIHSYFSQLSPFLESAKTSDEF